MYQISIHTSFQSVSVVLFECLFDFHIMLKLLANSNFYFSALIKLQQLVRPPLSKTVQFIFRKSNPLTFREILKDVRTRGIYSIIIDTKPESLPHLLTAVRNPIHSNPFIVNGFMQNPLYPNLINYVRCV